ncbi:hypothetical protein Pcinc_018230 [Petrolisthes cinctipes]|uniref:Uncharacterized protein n=1 Tax=Petrolisthes cinctipes TaxID=88211 RepID=A0AAE1KLU8_PETCI|nr:hypothetical protein Pcinc_018230 [Petrolisthes cinctipes]
MYDMAENDVCWVGLAVLGAPLRPLEGREGRRGLLLWLIWEEAEGMVKPPHCLRRPPSPLISPPPPRLQPAVHGSVPRISDASHGVGVGLSYSPFVYTRSGPQRGGNVIVASPRTPH